MSENEIDELRRRFAREAMALMERKGEEVSRTRLAAELSVARARIRARATLSSAASRVRGRGSTRCSPRKATCSKR